MWKRTLLFVGLLALSQWSPINTLPQGAPETVCDSMLPFHGGGIPPQPHPSPFLINPAAKIIGQGQSMQVELTGVPREVAFGGFMIQARNRNPPNQVIGQFNEHPEGLVKLMNCGGPQSSATHVNPTQKLGIVLEWQAPLDFIGEMAFNATVAQDYGKFWVGFDSEPIQIVKRDVSGPPSVVGISTTRPPYSSTVPIYIPQPEEEKVAEKDPFYEGCSTSKTCFGFPDGCVATQNCRSISSVIVKGDRYEFELKSSYNRPAYVALGFSSDTQMGDDLVIECVPQAGQIQTYLSWTSPRPKLGTSRTGVPQNSVRLITGSHIDGTIYCKVEKSPVTVVNGNTIDLINRKYHLLLAAGSAVRSDGVDYHNLGRLPTAQAINLAVVQDLAGSSVLLLRLHGAFMVAAWIGTTSLGILLARYFKQTWVGSQLCGKDQWFAWHRICMVLTWSLTMAGFVIIFVEIGDWSAERNPHAILGVITTVICFLQPIGALLRPAPNSKNRPYFNWGHWLGGNLAHILSIVTIFFSVKLTKAELPEWMDWILVAFVAFHVIMHLLFSISGCVADRQATQRVNSFQMADIHGARASAKIETKKDAPFASLRKGLLGVYIVILALFVIALVVIIALAPIEESVKKIKTQIMGS